MSKITSEEIDRIFDEGGDVIQYADPDSFERPNLKQRRVSVDMATGMIDRLDRWAFKIGVTRQSLIKMWLNDRLNQEDEREIARKNSSVA